MVLRCCSWMTLAVSRMNDCWPGKGSDARESAWVVVVAVRVRSSASVVSLRLRAGVFVGIAISPGGWARVYRWDRLDGCGC